MKKRASFGRLLICVMAVLLFAQILSSVFLLVLHYKYSDNYNSTIITVSEKLNNDYPDADFGINDFTPVLRANDELVSKLLIINAVGISVCAVTVILLITSYKRAQDKEVRDLSEYLAKLDKTDVRLYLEDNNEGELSRLKNELYKVITLLRETSGNAQQAKGALKDSLSDISHQIRTPLTSINIMLDNIMDDPDMPAEIRNDFIKEIKKEAVNISFLIEALLKLSRFDANTVSFDIKEKPLDELAKAAAENVALLADLKDVTVDTSGVKNTTVACDAKWLVEALTNIIKNCVEHTPSGGSICITSGDNSVYTLLTIKDTGVGIAPEDLRHVFERFYKGKNSSSESIGIGLALAKTIIEAGGGIIDVDSKPGEGAEFSVKFFKNGF